MEAGVRYWIFGVMHFHTNTMKTFLTLFLLFLSNSLFASWSEFAHVTPETEDKYKFDVDVKKSSSGEVFRITVPAASYDSKSAWLIITEKPLTHVQQKLRNTIWGISENPVGFVVKSQLKAQLVSSHKKSGKDEKYYYLELSKEIMKTAYIYIDFDSLVMDGGYYYSVDLATYISAAEPSADK